MDLLCSDFSKINPPKDSEENEFGLTDTFSELSQAFSHQTKALTIIKILMHKEFCNYSNPA